MAGAGLAAAALCLPPAAAGADGLSGPGGPGGAGPGGDHGPVFVQTNDPTGNQVVSYL